MYLVKATISKSFQRVTGTLEHTTVYGKFKRLLNAKRLRAKLNKDRALFWTDDHSEVKDYGPTFKKVWIETAGEEEKP